MTNKPQDRKPDERPAPENAPAPDDKRTEKEAAERQGGAELPPAGDGRRHVTPIAKDSSSEPGDNTDSVENSSDEPVIEDEP